MPDRLDVHASATAAGAGPSWLRRVGTRVRENAAAILYPVAAFVRPVLEGFHAHGWSGKVFIGLTGLSLLGSIGGWLVLTFQTMLRSGPFQAFPLAVTIFGILPGIVIQWWFLKSVARFGPNARVIAMIGCTLGAFGATLTIIGRGPVTEIVPALAGLGVCVQSYLYFRSEEFFERASAFRSLEEEN